MYRILKPWLKGIRAWPPVNYLATGVAKGICNVLPARYTDYAAWYLPRSGNVRTTLPNGSELLLWSHGDDWIANQVYWRGWKSYEGEALPLFYALAKRADVILDVGANIGLYSLAASYANAYARIFAFEPLPVARDRLTHNIHRNRRSNIEVVPYAISNTRGQQPFYYPDWAVVRVPDVSSLLQDFVTNFTAEPPRCLQVDVTTIDDFCQEHGITDVGLVKLDIEGLEPQAIEGMRRTIERSRPHLFVEILAGKGTDTALDTLARHFGYNAFALDSTGPHFQSCIAVDPRRRNYLFTVMSPTELHHFMITAVHPLTPRLGVAATG